MQLILQDPQGETTQARNYLPSLSCIFVSRRNKIEKAFQKQGFAGISQWKKKSNGATMRNSAAIPGGSQGNVVKILVSVLNLL